MPVPVDFEEWEALMRGGVDVLPLPDYSARNPWGESVWANTNDAVNSEAGRWAQMPREQLAQMRPPPPPLMPPSAYLSRVPITIEDCFGRLSVGRSYVSGAARWLPMAQGGTDASARNASSAKNPMG